MIRVRWFRRGLRFLGWRPDSTSHREKLVSALGTTLALILLYGVTHLVMAEAALWVTGSMVPARCWCLPCPTARCHNPGR